MVRAGTVGLVASLGVAIFISETPETHATIDTGANALQLAQSIASDPGIITGAALVAVPGGTPNGVSDTPLAGFPLTGGTYAILTTGSALLAPMANTSGASGADDSGPSIRGDTDFDVTILRIDVTVPSGINCLVGLDFRFLSEEYPEFVGSSYNDAFIAELDSTTWTTSGSTITAPNNFAFDPAGSEISVNAAGVTSMTAANASGTTYDGATPVLRAKTPITPGAHSIYLSIFDQQDHIFDSAVFIDNLVLGTVGNPATQCQTGALPAADTERLSVDSAEVQGNAASTWVSLSGDGRFGAVASVATNLVSGDTNGASDIFVRDRLAGTTERVSIDSGEAQSNGVSNAPSISGDGRYVVFSSTASNLVTGDTNGVEDVFLRDRQAGTTERLSVDSAGTQANGGSFSSAPAGISSDGRFVTFCSDATNLVGSDTNATLDTFVRDRQTGTTERVSVSSSEDQGNAKSCENSGSSISDDGNLVAFPSVATNLVTGDTNGENDVFVRDRVAGTTQRVSVDSSGTQGNGLSAWPSLSADGRYVGFSSLATNLASGDTNGTWDIFLYDRQTGTMERVSIGDGEEQGNANSGYSSLSDDGRYVAFFAYSTNLVAGDTNGTGDVFVRDRQGGTTTRATVDDAGNQGTGPNTEIGTISISADGSLVAFYAAMTNLVTGDTNLVSDAFVHGLGAAPGPPAPTPTPSPTPGPTPPPGGGAGTNFIPTTGIRFCNAIPSGFSFTDPDLAGNPACSETLATSANADQTTFLNLPSGDLNLSNVVTMMPNLLTLSSVPVGAKVGGLRSLTTLGLINGSCSTAVTVDFVLWNVALPNNLATPRTATNIAWPQAPGVTDRFAHWKVGGGTHTSNPPLPADPEWASGGDAPILVTGTGLNAAGTTLGVQNYPVYLLDLFDPDFVPGVGDGIAQPRVPTAVYGGLTQVAGSWIPLYFAQFGANGLVGLPSPYGFINANMGQPNVSVLTDPTATLASSSAITDFCTPLDTATMLWGNPGSHPGNPAGVRSTNPSSPGTYYFSQYNASLRDLDQDGYEDSLDTCPKNAVVAEDPRTAAGDTDGDGIKDSCDPNVDAANDSDSDGFLNRGDNCPIVANPTQEEFELGVFQADGGPRTDNIGDACDSGSVTFGQNGRSVTVALSTGVANGRWLTKTNLIPKCIGGTDSDGDGYCSTQDSGADSGACSTAVPPSCTVRHNAWSGATHPALQQDTDGDGWSDALESYLSTDPAKACAQDSPINNESPFDNWPFDFNDSASATIVDVATFSSRFGKVVNVAPASTRWDFNSDGVVTILDVAKYSSVFGKTCSSAGVPPWSQQ